jgi:hypothetical protein
MSPSSGHPVTVYFTEPFWTQLREHAGPGRVNEVVNRWCREGYRRDVDEAATCGTDVDNERRDRGRTAQAADGDGGL